MTLVKRESFENKTSCIEDNYYSSLEFWKQVFYIEESDSNLKTIMTLQIVWIVFKTKFSLFMFWD